MTRVILAAAMFQQHHLYKCKNSTQDGSGLNGDGRVPPLSAANYVLVLTHTPKLTMNSVDSRPCSLFSSLLHSCALYLIPIYRSYHPPSLRPWHSQHVIGRIGRIISAGTWICGCHSFELFEVPVSPDQLAGC
jgi:hypothetical protein